MSAIDDLMAECQKLKHELAEAQKERDALRQAAEPVMDFYLNEYSRAKFSGYEWAFNELGRALKGEHD